MNPAPPWRPVRALRLVRGRSLRAVTQGDATAVCVDDLADRDCAVVNAMVPDSARPVVDGSGAWVYPGDVERALARADVHRGES